MEFEIWWLLAFTVVMTVLRGVYKLALALIERRASRTLPADLEQRLARIEYAVESTAVEVERIGESQRFLTRMLTERGRADDVGRVAAAPERIITPH
jgi:hypothetical protein